MTHYLPQVTPLDTHIDPPETPNDPLLKSPTDRLELLTDPQEAQNYLLESPKNPLEAQIDTLKAPNDPLDTPMTD